MLPGTPLPIQPELQPAFEFQKRATSRALWLTLGLGGFSMLAAAIPSIIASSHATRRAERALTALADAHSMSFVRLASVSVRASPEQLAAVTGVAADSSHRMRVPLTESKFTAVTFSWDVDHLAHVDRFYFESNQGHRDDESVRMRLLGVLGRRLDKDSSFNWEGASLSMGSKDGSINAGAQVPDSHDPHASWDRQVDALWDVARAAIGLPVRVDDAAVRDWLGRGYPMAQLAAFDSQTDIEHSGPAMIHSFPGSTSTRSSGLTYTVAIDHPWFGEARLEWPDAKGARLQRGYLEHAPGQTKFSSQGDVESCVGHVFGKPERKDTPDYLTGRYSTRWKPKEGGSFTVSDSSVMISFEPDPWTKAMPDSVWKKLVNAFEACGPKR
jgi:hypothetical protein